MVNSNVMIEFWMKENLVCLVCWEKSYKDKTALIFIFVLVKSDVVTYQTYISCSVWYMAIGIYSYMMISTVTFFC